MYGRSINTRSAILNHQRLFLSDAPVADTAIPYRSFHDVNVFARTSSRAVQTRKDTSRYVYIYIS